jgi:alcohol dehydrogenase class IV
MPSFRYTSAEQEVLFGAGYLSKLPSIAEQHNWRRLMLCTTPHLQINGMMALVENVSGQCLTVSYDKVEPHVPEHQVEEALSLARQYRVDAIIGLGGGSPIGMAKAASLEFETGRLGQPKVSDPTTQTLLPVIAIPTTYAGSEMTPIYGVTRKQPDGSTSKVTVRDPRIPPKVVIYDPKLTTNLPPEMTAATGINALAHCIEAVYSKTRNPLSTSAALRGIFHINSSLASCYRNGEDLGARNEMQLGAHLAGASLATVSMGIHHGTGHVLGGTAGVPHGIANGIVLPHAIRFNADTVAPQLVLSAEAMGIVRNGRSDVEIALKIADQIYTLIDQLGLPHRLRDAGVDRSILPKLARNMLENTAVRNNPKSVTSVSQTLPYLEAMW